MEILINEVHLRVPVELIQAESLGEVQLSLGKMAQPSVLIDSLICDSNSGNKGGSGSCSDSSSDSCSWDIIKQNTSKSEAVAGGVGVGECRVTAAVSGVRRQQQRCRVGWQAAEAQKREKRELIKYRLPRIRVNSFHTR
ncbi:unnamed protein product [Lactuca saligna]|uniref:Uncharacterized protein n=1 Tax=Lactuca saligna TaxID=75948 RepID=A0AA36A386_LACSI|nr:unnamed protein product [Lactuca saligna]